MCPRSQAEILILLMSSQSETVKARGYVRTPYMHRSPAQA